jgi:hypothetical protein
MMQERIKSARKIKKKTMAQCIATTAGHIVSKGNSVSVPELFIEMGWLTHNKLLDWKSGKIPYLERVITANLTKIGRAMKEFRQWAMHSKLKAHYVAYQHKGHRLRFSKTGHPTIESAYCTHYKLTK